jgi:peptidoglycan/LPS O-acetylase OafA/YrhL
VLFFKSVSYTALFASNYRFYRVQDYFAPEADLQPLVHTWSLGIEEQYYLVFPLVILLLYRFRNSFIVPAIFVVGAVSFVLAQRMLGSDSSAAFFLTPYRVWELMIGSLVAAAVHRGHVAVRPNEALAAIGLALIFAAAFLFSDATPFPGAYALIPTLGAALVILFATPQTWVGRGLGSRPLVAIGLVSYSAYLWHQPLFAFAKLRFGAYLSPSVMLALCVGVFQLAALTWYFVEQPARRMRLRSAKPLFAGAAAVTLAFFALGHAGRENRPVSVARRRLRPHRACVARQQWAGPRMPR